MRKVTCEPQTMGLQFTQSFAKSSLVPSKPKQSHTKSSTKLLCWLSYASKGFIEKMHVRLSSSEKERHCRHRGETRFEARAGKAIYQACYLRTPHSHCHFQLYWGPGLVLSENGNHLDRSYPFLRSFQPGITKEPILLVQLLSGRSHSTKPQRLFEDNLLDPSQ